MKVTHEVDHLTGSVTVIASWNIREQRDADCKPLTVGEKDESSAAEILLDAERIIRRIEAHQRRR
jgi:hypothetical protein